MRLLLILLALTACDNESASGKFADLTPAKCREFGVGVQDSNPMMGVVDHQNGKPMSEPLSSTTFNRVQRECGPNDHLFYGGCAIDLGKGHYDIWSADSQCISIHELCHAKAQSIHHTGPFLAKSNAPDWHSGWLASCPS